MSKIKSKKILPAAIAPIIVTLALICGGCGGDKKCPVCPEEEPPEPYAEKALVLGADSAWVDIGYSDGNRHGFIFTADGSFNAISDSLGIWTVRNTGLVSAEDGALSVIEGQLYFGFESGVAATYAISQDTLKLVEGGVTNVFLKTADVKPFVGLTKGRKSKK